ncbi:hypothetical protein G6F36_014340 [Rhizopus arrhizus]|nr:hypothetical protein G6F36_014340 [Rhizopus arrhizus]
MPKSLSADIKTDIKSALLAGKDSMDVANRFETDGCVRSDEEIHQNSGGYSISYKTAINVLKSMNFFPAIKVKKPLLTTKHMKRQLARSKKYQNWTTDDWRRVVFSDETKVNIWGSDGCKYYWSRPGDPLKPHHIDVTVKHGGGSLMMWGCMTYEGPGILSARW